MKKFLTALATSTALATATAYALPQDNDTDTAVETTTEVDTDGDTEAEAETETEVEVEAPEIEAPEVDIETTTDYDDEDTSEDEMSGDDVDTDTMTNTDTSEDEMTGEPAMDTMDSDMSADTTVMNDTMSDDTMTEEPMADDMEMSDETMTTPEAVTTMDTMEEPAPEMETTDMGTDMSTDTTTDMGAETTVEADTDMTTETTMSTDADTEAMAESTSDATITANDDMAAAESAPVDTDAFFVICANVLGGCMGTTGPRDPDPATGRPYALDFPVITIGDMVRAQRAVIDSLGIERLLCVAGGSMGGMQVLEWASRYPDRLVSALPIACAARHTAQNIAFHEVGRQAIMADPDWVQGDYLARGLVPRRGLSVARMTAHITYLSEGALHRKFGRRLQDRTKVTFGFDADFQVESYLRHQGTSFVDRFDANSYLYITRAMDYFDLAAEHGGQLAEAFRGSPVRFCVVSFTSDWLFPTPESKAIVRALNAAAADVSFVEIESDAGHDAFLLNEPEFISTVHAFLNATATQQGLPVAELRDDAALPDPSQDRIS